MRLVKVACGYRAPHLTGRLRLSIHAAIMCTVVFVLFALTICMPLSRNAYSVFVMKACMSLFNLAILAEIGRQLFV